MSTINKAKCQQIRARLNEVLAELGEELDVTFNVGNMSFNDTEANIKLSALAKGNNGEVISKEALAWNNSHMLLGLPKNGLGKTIVLNGQKMTISGLNLRARKYPVCIKSVKGENYKTTVESIINQL